MTEKANTCIFIISIKTKMTKTLKTGITGTWSFTKDDKLSQELEEITFRMSEGKDTDKDGKRLNEIIKIVEQDISDVVGYRATISDNGLFYLDNDTELGKWFKVMT